MLSAKGGYSVPCSGQDRKKYLNCSQNTASPHFFPLQLCKGNKVKILQCVQSFFSPQTSIIALEDQVGDRRVFHNEPLKQLPQFLPYQLDIDWCQPGAEQGEGRGALFPRSGCCLKKRQGKRNALGSNCRWKKNPPTQWLQQYNTLL